MPGQGLLESQLRRVSDDKNIPLEKRRAPPAEDGSLQRTYTPKSRVLQLSPEEQLSMKQSKDIVIEHYPESDVENGLVGWEGQDDPLNPRYAPLAILSEF